MRYPVHRVHSAYCYRCPVGLKRESCHIECVQQLERLLEERGEQIAAVIVEPLLQGAGGMIVHPVEFLQKVRALCTKHDVLLIADEVLTGFGRTGKMFACDLANVVAGLDVRFEGHHRRIHDHGRDAVHGSRGVCVSQREPDAHVLSRAFVHGKCAGLRRGQCQSADFRRRTGV